jgi:DNA modification methylase
MSKVLISVKTKSYFKEKNFVLYHSDLFDVLSDLPEHSIDMIFADPPYNLSNDGFSIRVKGLKQIMNFTVRG